jgi:hypothetical protein
MLVLLLTIFVAEVMMSFLHRTSLQYLNTWL